MKQSEVKYYGVNACLKIFEKRPSDIIRVYIEKSKLSLFSDLLKWCAKEKKAYHLVESQELGKITESVHHEGICILANELVAPSFEEILQDILKKETFCLLYLDGIENPHNIGSILRSASHFNIPCVLGNKDKLTKLPASACRVAQGGAELVPFILLQNPIVTLKKLKEKNISLLATSCHRGTSLYQTSLPKKHVLLIGSEEMGLSPAILQLADQMITIPGTGQIESLNVSVATSLFLGEFWRQNQTPLKK